MTVLPFHGANTSRSNTGPGIVRGFPPTITLDVFSKGYVDCALWVSFDDTEKPFGLRFGMNDIAAVTLRQMANDCLQFQRDNAEMLTASYRPHYSKLHAGRDFWLTRNRFQDGFLLRSELPEIVRVSLAEAAQAWSGYALAIGPVHGLLGTAE